MFVKTKFFQKRLINDWTSAESTVILIIFKKVLRFLHVPSVPRYKGFFFNNSRETPYMNLLAKKTKPSGKLHMYKIIKMFCAYL